MEIPFETNTSVPQGDYQKGVVTQFFFRDPDGYYIELCNCDILTEYCFGETEHNIDGKHFRLYISTFLYFEFYSLFRTFSLSNLLYFHLSLAETFSCSNFFFFELSLALELSLARAFSISFFLYSELSLFRTCSILIFF